jgi:homoaconitase
MYRCVQSLTIISSYSTAESMKGLATIANMGAEVGATTSTFPYIRNMRSYLHATRRGPVAHAADKAAEAGYLSADVGAEYDEVIEIVRTL